MPGYLPGLSYFGTNIVNRVCYGLNLPFGLRSYWKKNSFKNVLKKYLNYSKKNEKRVTLFLSYK